jgi:hypothetical protein
MRILAAALGFLLVSPFGASEVQAQEAPPIEIAIQAAVGPLPQEFRDGATVLTRDGSTVLRPGDGPFICLADDPADERFHVACYHRSLEPFMARGRQLRAEGRAAQVDSLRHAEIEAGVLDMPTHPAALYSLTGPPGSLDPDSGEVTGARPLFVIYVPFATGESTGLPTTGRLGQPWLMDPGTAKAHIMFIPEMN